MKTRAKQMATSAIVAALTASLAPVPASSATPIIPVIESQQIGNMTSHLTFDLTERLFFLPLPEATSYLQSITNYMRRVLSDGVAKRDLRGSKGRLFSKEALLRKTLIENIEHSRQIMTAIKTVMQDDYLKKAFPDLAEREEYKTRLIKFGRAVANNLYTTEDALSHIDQQKSPEATCNAPQPDGNEVKALIASEHRKLGLHSPDWV
ncbi:hypothetical protein RC452_002436 [Salmonella enterica]|nr:hypothetical protein [Salmonella enterica]